MVEGKRFFTRRALDLLMLANGVAFFVWINLLAEQHFWRIDLTEERKHTIKEQTQNMLAQLDDEVFVEVFLEGDLNPTFTRLRKSVENMLEEFKIYSNGRVQFTYTNPQEAKGAKARREFMEFLQSKGIAPTNVIENQAGKRVEKIIFPGAIISVGTAQRGLTFLKGNRSQGAQEAVNQSIENLEFNLATIIHNMTVYSQKRVGLLTGHGELDSLSTQGLRQIISQSFQIFSISADRLLTSPLCDALIIAKPTRPFTEKHKYILDQYIMRGGNVLFLLDALDVNTKVKSTDEIFAYSHDVSLNDQLFTYGVRLNEGFIQDARCCRHPVVAGYIGDQPQVVPFEWPFYPLITQHADHVITRNLDALCLRYVGSLDTVKARGIKKTILVHSSPSSRFIRPPLQINVRELRRTSDGLKKYQKPLPIACLLEGRFTSIYANRLLPKGADPLIFKDKGQPARLIVVADGDIARNEINLRTQMPETLGYDAVSGYTFSNADILHNMVAYLVDKNGLIVARNKEVKMRPLDTEKIQRTTYWQFINIACPILILIVFGVGNFLFWKIKYARHV